MFCSYKELVKYEHTIDVYHSFIIGMFNPHTNCAADAGEKAASNTVYFKNSN